MVTSLDVYGMRLNNIDRLNKLLEFYSLSESILLSNREHFRTEESICTLIADKINSSYIIDELHKAFYSNKAFSEYAVIFRSLRNDMNRTIIPGIEGFFTKNWYMEFEERHSCTIVNIIKFDVINRFDIHKTL